MTNNSGNVAVVILAAGLGTRMKSNKAKVLHEILGRPMISYVVDTAQAVAGDQLVIVVGHQADQVRRTVAVQADVFYAHQEEQLGTGHAVMCAMPVLPEATRHVVILCGDVPLLKKETVKQFVDEHQSQKRTLSVLAVRVDSPKGYGRIVQDSDGTVTGIVEEADATPTQKAINLINTGIYCVDRHFLGVALGQVTADNAQGEYYLTDIVDYAHRKGLSIGVTIGSDPSEFIGINSREQLQAVEQLMRSTPDMN